MLTCIVVAMEPTDIPTDIPTSSVTPSALRRSTRSRWFLAGAASMLLGIGGLAVSAGASDGSTSSGADGADGSSGIVHVCAAAPLDALPPLGTFEAGAQAEAGTEVAVEAAGQIRAIEVVAGEASAVVTDGEAAIAPASGEDGIPILDAVQVAGDADASCYVVGASAGVRATAADTAGATRIAG